MLLPVIAFGTDAPHRLSPKGIKMRSLIWLAGFSRQQKESKKCAVLFNFQGTAEAIEKASSLSMPKSEEADNQEFLIFYNFFEFFKNFDFALMYCNL